tara:strand:- start:526 stop:1341 length:816 start_codon:yes stop_codon:yes gene_type:complete
MFNLEKIENLYLLILRYVIVVVASLAVITAIIMLLTGFLRSMTGDPDLPTEDYRSSANSNVATSDIILGWVPDGEEKEGLKSFIEENVDDRYSRFESDGGNYDELTNTFLQNAFGVSYTNKSFVTDIALFGDNSQEVTWQTRWTDENSDDSDNLNLLWNSMLRDHLRNLDQFSPWFQSLGESRRNSYKDFLLENIAGDTPRFIASFNTAWKEWIQEEGNRYDKELMEAEATRASAIASYTTALISFGIFLFVMFMSLIAFIERNTAKISNK